MPQLRPAGAVSEQCQVQQPVSAHHLGCGVVQGEQSHEAAPSTSLAVVSPSAAVALAWTGELHTGEGSSDLGRENHFLMLVVRNKARFFMVPG